MAIVNENFLKLTDSYLFSEVASRIEKFLTAHPDANIIRLGIGDVTQPLTPTVIEALKKAVNEMGDASTFRGYGPEQGYEFLREKIVEFDYQLRGVNVSKSEVFVSDGAKSDLGNIGDILGGDNIVAIADPVYPVYIDTNVMAGRSGDFIDGRWSNIIYLPCTAENNFIPQLPSKRPDVVYLCFPNNPTGVAPSFQQLEMWVDYALRNDVLILYDSAYEAYISSPNVPHSIYEIDGAKKVAIEFRSFSKTAGFTGLRCGYTVVPQELDVVSLTKGRTKLNPLWNRRQCTKFNGTAYIVQRAAEAVYSEQGRIETRKNIEYYMGNAEIIRNGLKAAGFVFYGGTDAPYIWMQCPKSMSSWQFFDLLLNECHVVGTPGVGFGPSGEGYFRLTAFGNREKTQEAVNRIVSAFS